MKLAHKMNEILPYVAKVREIIRAEILTGEVDDETFNEVVNLLNKAIELLSKS